MAPSREAPPCDQILDVEAMRAAEAALIAGGISADELMQRAGRGVADYVWRMAAGRPVTVLAGVGNNGGDGYVIAEAIRVLYAPIGGSVAVVASGAPQTETARRAAALYHGDVLDRHAERSGAVMVDALFGSGLTRPLSPEDAALLARLAARHPHRIAVDVPSGVVSDTGVVLNPQVPQYDLTVALGAWKYAHMLMPAVAHMGALRLVGIGVAPVAHAGQVLRRPRAIRPPAADAHKYTRGCLTVIAGAMPGAAVLAARAAQGAGAGYVRVASERPIGAPADIVNGAMLLAEDERNTALLVGPGMGKDSAGEARLNAAFDASILRNMPMVLDADALVLLKPRHVVGRPGMMTQRPGALIATPHEGELATMEGVFGLKGKTVDGANKIARALALAEKTGAVIVAKGPDTIIASPQGQWLAAPRGTAWLSTAGTGDVLAGVIASRLACGMPAFAAAAQGVWLHAEAARQAGVAFSASKLAETIPSALALCMAPA